MTERPAASLPPDYFETLYAAAPDPWDFATSGYEAGKYAATLAALPRPHYAAALEIGCSIGVLTQMLAARCDRLLALDVAEGALATARARCAGLPVLDFRRMAVPGNWPEGSFDLILLSEVVYYLDRADVARLVERVCAALQPGGDVVLVHWTGATDYPLSGDAAAEAFIADAAGRLALMRQQRAERYRLDLLRRLPVVG
ncbi:MAG: methyltransferase type 12 [Belnapia sp.]|nr:methyltransferase type 12 [Belnapia sp.]